MNSSTASSPPSSPPKYLGKNRRSNTCLIIATPMDMLNNIEYKNNYDQDKRKIKIRRGVNCIEERA